MFVIVRFIHTGGTVSFVNELHVEGCAQLLCEITNYDICVAIVVECIVLRGCIAREIWVGDCRGSLRIKLRSTGERDERIVCKQNCLTFAV